MNECQKIESALWDYNSLSASRRAEIDRHLSSCPRCMQAAETIRALGESAVKTMDSAASIDPQAFDREVMRKIALEKVISVAPLIESRRNNWRMAVSFAMAAAVVLIMVKSVGDLDNINPTQVAQAPAVEEKKYGRINIELAPAEPAERQPDMAAKTLAESPATPSVGAPMQKNELPKVLSEQAPLQRLESEPAKFAAKAIAKDEGDSRQQEQVFSILPAPVTSPDSINIDAVYVSNESISLHQQASAASLTELYSDTAAVQSAPLQMSRVVTIEKMPQPLRIEVPEYPVWAKKRGISGTVWIKARVTSDGKVSDALVLSCDSKGAGFEEAALEAARNNLFVPASSNGINLSVWVVYPVKFINKN